MLLAINKKSYQIGFQVNVMRSVRFFGLTLCSMLFMLSLNPTQAASTQSQHNQVKKDIRVVGQQLSKAEKKANQIDQQIEDLEKKIGVIEKQRYKTSSDINVISKKLEVSEAEFKVLNKKLEKQKTGMVQQMQALHTAGEQSHLRLLLKQDDPSDISRTIKYFEYLNRSRLKKIRSIKGLMTEVKEAKTKITQDREVLRKLKYNLGEQQKELEPVLVARTKALEASKKVVVAKKRLLAKLKRREKGLQSKLNALIKRQERQRKIAAARKKKAAERARQKAAAKKAASKSSKTTASRAPSKPAKKPAKSSKPAGKMVGEQRFVANKPFSKLRGKLSWPVAGRLSASYGTRRNEKQRWKGVMIDAKGGARVRAIAKGKVEFAGWFKGFGYLIIIRHDNSYRSLYGYNRAVHVREGQVVKAGTVIASVGNSGGQKKNALYFEIRKGSRTQNPKKWCR